ncbi:hypothetical protein I4U23_010624 [Adineta vaga]|nr:hypothetical protein I4U23_010624 [Adineta vaga]
MAQSTQPFLRIEILKFQINNQKQTIDLSRVKTEIEIKEKSQSTQTLRIKKPVYSETNQCIRFDIGLFINIERIISIRLFYKDILYTFDSDLKVLHKSADGFRHQFNFTPKSQVEMIIEYKDPSVRLETQNPIKMHSQRYAERYQTIYKHFGHRFVAKIFKTPIFCSICSEILWGFTYKGFQCQRCDCVVHKECYDRCVHPCIGKKYSDFDVSKAHQFERQTFSLQTMFCDHDGSFIRPGHAYKCAECLLVVHRRCQTKVGNYCGCKGKTLEDYEQWKENNKTDSDYNYQYNGDLCEIYTKLTNTNKSNETQEVIQRMSKAYQPNITAGFDLNQIQFLRILGRGMTSSVYLIKRDESFYAMKTLRKNLILEGQNLSYIQSERNILTRCQSNPFIVQLFYAFQNVERLFFLLEVARAGTLFDLLEHQAPKPFRHERIVFFIGEVTCALMFLHSKYIVYRDLKPENLFLFDDGHLKLGDFGLSKENIDENHKTRTMCGTAEYIAYEIYHKDWYDENIDWWSLGILIFELSTFRTPFYANNSTDITQNVLSNQVIYPERMKEEVKQIISGLLERDPKERLGNINSPHGLIGNQPFFQEPYTLDAIKSRRISPPWIPNSLLSLKATSKTPQLSELDPKDTILLLSTPANAFRKFSYVSPNTMDLF